MNPKHLTLKFMNKHSKLTVNKTYYPYTTNE